MIDAQSLSAPFIYKFPPKSQYPISIGVACYLEGAYLYGVINMSTNAGTSIIIPYPDNT